MGPCHLVGGHAAVGRGAGVDCQGLETLRGSGETFRGFCGGPVRFSQLLRAEDDLARLRRRSASGRWLVGPPVLFGCGPGHAGLLHGRARDAEGRGRGGGEGRVRGYDGSGEEERESEGPKSCEKVGGGGPRGGGSWWGVSAGLGWRGGARGGGRGRRKREVNHE